MPKDSLREYSAKRRFDATPEPQGEMRARDGPLLFVVQKHAARALHYDLRLEVGGVLKSWAVPRGPSLARGDKRLAVETEDHPFDYAAFEGVIPAKQYGAGEVIVWDCGVYSPDEGGTWYHDRAEAERRVLAELAAGKLSFTLRGEKLKGSFALVRTRGSPQGGASDAGKQWLLLKHRDRFMSEEDITTREASVLTGRAVEALKKNPLPGPPPKGGGRAFTAARLVPSGPRKPLPSKLAPMLAETGDKPFHREGWMWEPKLDGYRVLAFVDAKGVRLRSRRGLDYTAHFPKLAAELQLQAVDGMVLDGEIVAFDASGRPSFGALQERAQLKTPAEMTAADRTSPVVFFVFDMPHFAGVDLTGAPYADRRRWLAQCLLPSPLVQLVHAEADGVAMHSAALAAGFEGAIGKRVDSKYETGQRSGAWIKVKPVSTREFVVGGFTAGKGSRAAMGAILVGAHEGRKLVYASHVGSGFDERTLKSLNARLDKLRRDDCPFAEEPELNGPTVWVDPKVVVEVKFAAWTDDRRLRAPVFLRVREDVEAKKVKLSPSLGDGSGFGAPSLGEGAGGGSNAIPSRKGAGEIEAVLEQLDRAKATATLEVGPHRIKLTHLDRVYWPAAPHLAQPALTKRDLLRYLARVSPFMLTHLADRPLTLIRMPDGIGGQRFFQKHWEQARPGFADTVTVWSGHKGEEHEYLVCNNLPTLLWLAQSGTLEYHVWHSRARPGPDCVSQSTDYASSAEAIDRSVVNYPDWVVFDIDPYIYSGKEAKGAEPELNTVAFEKGKEVAFRLRELLATMQLEPIVKTSGKTGLHCFVPIERTIDFDAARHVSELVGRHLVRLYPKDVTVEWSVPKRTGKIFMDYNMNVRGKTLNVAYSPRGEPGAPVSMPLTWEELARVHPLDFLLTNAPERLARTGDRWAEALTAKQSLEGALGRARD